jgi:hypothetical protein
MMDKARVVASLLAIDEGTPAALTVIVVRAAAAMLESISAAEERVVDVGPVQQDWFIEELASRLGTKADSTEILKAVERLRARSSKAHQKTVLDRWANAKPKTKKG